MSYNRVIRECEAQMVEDYIPYLQGECRQMVKDENIPGTVSTCSCRQAWSSGWGTGFVIGRS